MGGIYTLYSENITSILEPGERAAYERLSTPLAIYQLVNNKVITLLVSDGLCEMAGKDRACLTNHYNDSMFGSVHPEDVEMLAQIGYRFAHEEGNYDVIYRTKLYDKEEYRLVHSVGRFQNVISGARVAFLMYSDVTEIQKKIYDNTLEVNDPKVDFFNENLGPVVVVAQKDNRLLYYNQAICRMLPPRTNFDSGITFQQFFFPDFPDGMKGLMDAVNCGTRVVKEPYTNRDMEISVIASTWNKERAYVIYFYEVFSESYEFDDETMLRHRRMAFNNVMFAGKQSGFSYSEKRHQGFRIWNLSKKEVVYFEEYSLSDQQDLEQITFEEYFLNLKTQCVEYEDKLFLENFTGQQMIMLYQADNYPRQRIIHILTSQGLIYVSLEIILMQSPDTGEIYIKVWEENITDKEIISVLASKAVEQDFDYIAYLDVLADKGWIIYGNRRGETDKTLCKKINDFSRSAEFHQIIEEFLRNEIHNIDELVSFISQNADAANSFSTIRQMEDSKIKRLHIQMIDQSSKILYIRCADITQFLSKEKEREKELELARNNAMEANRHLQVAVLAEREKVEAILVQTILAVNKALDAKDPYTCRHSERVAKYASEIARKLNWNEKRVNNIYNISLVHDIGKIGIPDSLLLKPSALTDSEYEVIKEHVTVGSNILRDFTAIENIYEGILYHHERYDGHGYVFGLKTDDIPIEARIIGIADAVDAMYSTRPYRERQSIEFIISELVHGKGKQFDPYLVDIMLELIETGLLEIDKEITRVCEREK